MKHRGEGWGDPPLEGDDEPGCPCWRVLPQTLASRAGESLAVEQMHHVQRCPKLPLNLLNLVNLLLNVLVKF